MQRRFARVAAPTDSTTAYHFSATHPMTGGSAPAAPFRDSQERPGRFLGCHRFVIIGFFAPESPGNVYFLLPFQDH
jgi:hypothetical protein